MTLVLGSPRRPVVRSRSCGAGSRQEGAAGHDRDSRCMHGRAPPVAAGIRGDGRRARCPIPPATCARGGARTRSAAGSARSLRLREQAGGRTHRPRRPAGTRREARRRARAAAAPDGARAARALRLTPAPLADVALALQAGTARSDRDPARGRVTRGRRGRYRRSSARSRVEPAPDRTTGADRPAARGHGSAASGARAGVAERSPRRRTGGCDPSPNHARQGRRGRVDQVPSRPHAARDRPSRPGRPQRAAPLRHGHGAPADAARHAVAGGTRRAAATAASCTGDDEDDRRRRGRIPPAGPHRERAAGRRGPAGGMRPRRRRSSSSSPRSEERRVGKECRSRWSPYH